MVLLCSLAWPQIGYIVQADLKLTNLLSSPSECWHYRYVLPLPAVYEVLRMLLWLGLEMTTKGSCSEGLVPNAMFRGEAFGM
jgi:hypothetical protein